MRTLTLIALAALLAVVVARAGPRRDQAERKPGSAAGRRRVDPDAMTDAEGEEFEKKNGFNPRKNQARMKKLRAKQAARARKQSNNKEAAARREKFNKEIGEVREEKPLTKEGEENVVDLSKINEESGVADLLVEGDINLTDEQFEDYEKETEESDGARAKRQVTTIYKKWTSNTVYYTYDASIDATKKAAIVAGINYLASRTCLKFVESATATNRLRFINGAGCYSNIGMIGGVQDVSIGNGCEVIGTVVHEIMHALGVFHFQSRYDRDSYVAIDMTYVPADRQNNFVKYTSAQTVNYTPYEYGSTMHYSANSFVSQSGAISVWPSDQDYIFTMGNRIVSFYDIKLVNTHYACTCASGATCVNGGERNPKNCAQCLCPLGYGGTTCNTRPTGCGSSLTATTTWQTTLIQVGVDSQTVRNDFTFCNTWVTAPSGKTLQFNITGNFNTQCQYGCPFNGLEIKNKADLKAASPRHCCANTFNQVISSTNNPTPLIAYNRYYITQFQVAYRYV